MQNYVVLMRSLSQDILGTDAKAGADEIIGPEISLQCRGVFCKNKNDI